MNDKKSVNPLLWATNVRSNEVKAAVVSFLFIFTLMAAYYLLRPIRDAMASDWSDAEVSMLWTINFFISTCMVALYGFVVSKVQFHKIVPAVYLFFAASFFLFYFLVRSEQETTLIDKTFYVWVSVFALFHVSVFWSLMADTFNHGQAARMFSIFAAGASLGAMAGPIISSVVIPQYGINMMMPLAALALLMIVPAIFYLYRLKHSELNNGELSADLEQVKIGGNPFAGFADFFSNRYLLGIGVFIILYTGTGSFVYLELKNLLVDYSREERAVIYASRDFITNTITFVMAFFLTGRVVPKLGMPTALLSVPLILIFGMLVLAFSPVLMVALAVWIARSAGNYGLARPAREMLFTQVNRESRFKTKPVVDIVAYRGGDVIMGWFFAFLTTTLELGLAAVAVVGAGIAALWGVVGYLLGRSYQQKIKSVGE